MHPNLFESANRVWCFNHTLQLSVKALLKPFGAPSKDTDNSGNDDEDNKGCPELEMIPEDEDEDRDWQMMSREWHGFG